jgi:hypothetical protein
MILTLHMKMFKETMLYNSLTIHELDNKMINESIPSIGISLHPTVKRISFFYIVTSLQPIVKKVS